LLCSCLLRGQAYFRITNYNSKQGLSNSSVYDIIKDETGFLWISTEMGINKFDGHNFKKYTAKSHNLPDNTIPNSTVINNNALFFSTGTSGYFTFDIKKEKASVIDNKKSSFIYKSHDIKTYKNKVYIVSLQNDYI